MERKSNMYVDPKMVYFDDVTPFIDPEDFKTDHFDVVETRAIGESDGVTVNLSSLQVWIRVTDAILNTPLGLALWPDFKMQLDAKNTLYEVDLTPWVTKPTLEQHKKFKRYVETHIAEIIRDRIASGYYEETDEDRYFKIEA